MQDAAAEDRTQFRHRVWSNGVLTTDLEAFSTQWNLYKEGSWNKVVHAMEKILVHPSILTREASLCSGVACTQRPQHAKFYRIRNCRMCVFARDSSVEPHPSTAQGSFWKKEGKDDISQGWSTNMGKSGFKLTGQDISSCKLLAMEILNTKLMPTQSEKC